ncbi:MAG: F0F1 ATP synthase subunit delta [Clostridiales bacterium]|nr:F0F1 ATP synthase subunit delta [Clostridiales bacterium]
MSGLVATVVSAAELSDAQLSALTALLSQKLHNEVVLSVSIDPSLIGGLYIHVDGRVIDRSVKRQIADMKDSLKKGGMR